MDVRHPAERCLLVHRRRGLGDRPHLRLLRSAVDRRHPDHLRGRTDVSGRGPFLAHVPGPRVSVFYTAPTAIRSLIKANEAAPATHPTQVRPEQPAHPGDGGRADQSGSLDLVLQERRVLALPRPRHVLADGDRRPHDHPAAWRDAAGAGILHAAAARHRGGDRRRDRARRAQRPGRPSGRQTSVAGNDPHDLGRPGTLQEVLLPGRAGRAPLPGRRRLDPRQDHRLLHDRGAHRRRAERLWSPDGHDGDRIRTGGEPAGGRGGGGRTSRRPDRRGRVRLRRAQAVPARRTSRQP